MHLDGFDQIASLMSGEAFKKLQTAENALEIKPLELMKYICRYVVDAI